MVQEITLKGIEKYIEENYEYRGGWLYRIKQVRSSMPGDRVGSISKTQGYTVMRVLGKKLYAHRVIYWLHYKEWPHIIDHRDEDKTNNKLSNLINSTASSNILNHKKARSTSLTGVRGVSQKNGKGSYIVVFNAKYLGSYRTIKEAKEVYESHRDEELKRRRAEEAI